MGSLCMGGVVIDPSVLYVLHLRSLHYPHTGRGTCVWGGGGCSVGGSMGVCMGGGGSDNVTSIIVRVESYIETEVIKLSICLLGGGGCVVGIV